MSDNMHDALQLAKMIRMAAERQAKALERYLVTFFGSIEEASKEMDKYVLEVHETQIKLQNEWDIDRNIPASIETEYRLRLKTPSELAQDSRE